MYYTTQDIPKNSVIFFCNGKASPLTTNQQFIDSGGSIANALYDYKKNDIVEKPYKKGLPAIELENIKKLIKAKTKADAEGKKNINSIIHAKINELEGKLEGKIK